MGKNYSAIPPSTEELQELNQPDHGPEPIKSLLQKMII